MHCDPGRRREVHGFVRAAVVIAMIATTSRSATAQRSLPPYFADRGNGVATSMFGEYVSAGEFVFYPFYEYTRYDEFEYKPSEIGFGVDQHFRGRFVEHEANSFFRVRAH